MNILSVWKANSESHKVEGERIPGFSREWIPIYLGEKNQNSGHSEVFTAFAGITFGEDSRINFFPRLLIPSAFHLDHLDLLCKISVWGSEAAGRILSEKKSNKKSTVGSTENVMRANNAVMCTQDIFPPKSRKRSWGRDPQRME